MGGALDGQNASITHTSGQRAPVAALKRIVKAESLAATLVRMLSTPLSQPVRRSAWTFLDKVLNKALDYDARILHPESFSDIAARLDEVVRSTAIQIVDVVDFDITVENCVRLAAAHGGGDITPAHLKKLYFCLSASCQYLPKVADMLTVLGHTKSEIDGVLDLSGVQWCLDSLAARRIYIGFDGTVVTGGPPVSPLVASSIPWGQARKIQGAISEALQQSCSDDLRARCAQSSRDLARLHSSSGKLASKWLTEFPSSWWPAVPDDRFLTAIRFRFGIPIMPGGGHCMHTACRNQEIMCGKDLDIFGDHAVMCNFGPYIFARHGRVNNALAQAGRDAGYAALLEQVVPELAVKKHRGGIVVLEDAYLDVELFGHPYAQDRLLDATVRHPAAKRIVNKAARLRGAAAAEGVLCKERRYPAVGGKSIIPCALETWGFADAKLEALLDDLAVLASQRQRDRGQEPTRWKRRWMTLLRVGLAMDTGIAILQGMTVHCRPCSARPIAL